MDHTKKMVVDSRKRQLMTLRQGGPWRYMAAHFFQNCAAAPSLFINRYRCALPFKKVKGKKCKLWNQLFHMIR